MINDLVDLEREAMFRLFGELAEEGCEPRLEDDGAGLSIWTEEGSAALVLVAYTAPGIASANARHCLSLEAVPGEGEPWIAERLAEVVNEIVREASSDEVH